MRLQNKIAIVTGAAQGIGKAIAELFAAEGATVFACDVKGNTSFISSNIYFFSLDVSKEENWKSLLSGVEEKYGRLDVLVNNAGIVDYSTITEISPEAWSRIISINQTGALMGMKYSIPLMQKNKAGSIINFSSIWGKVAVAGAVGYHATKGAVLMMTKNAALTYVKDNIRVNSLHPGVINTPMVDAQTEETKKGLIAATPMGRMAEPIEIAYGVLFLASDESSFMTGAELVIDGGWTAQ